MTQCFDTGWCMWNGTCNDPDFGGGEGGFGGEGTGCFMFADEGLCNNLTSASGCSWSNGECTGPNVGITCEAINDSTFCGEIPFLDSCCGWGTTGCNTTFSTACWDSMAMPPSGGEYCEDYNAFSFFPK